ncbi:unnamed protein product [Caenorhabditis auriculariae]|uniref:Receptor-mediated endocytosis protein 6 n=1 Tax=Caenorhabditis auriculariae TaxID=2777116 RepID=A0A8S1H186_9PELO|nr:unnamed protein product [Caenorhabditis auriculariae]
MNLLGDKQETAKSDLEAKETLMDPGNEAIKNNAETIEILELAETRQIPLELTGQSSNGSNNQLDEGNAARGLDIIKRFGMRVKKGITPFSKHSDTISELLSEMAQSSKNESSLPTSISDNLLSKETPLSPDAILAKYAGKSCIPPLLPSPVGSIPERNMPEVEYYSSTNLLSCRAFSDTLRKLRTVLGNVCNLPKLTLLENTLIQLDQQKRLKELLQAVLAEKIHGRDHGMAARIREVIRCVDFFDSNGIDTLIDKLKEGNDEQERKILDLQAMRLRHMGTLSLLDALECRIELNKQLILESLVQLLTRAFFSVKEEEEQMTAFVREFRALHAQDERSDAVQKMVLRLHQKIPHHSLWKDAPSAMLSYTKKALEREVMRYVHPHAFYPNSDADRFRDDVFYVNVSKLVAKITHKSASIAINEKLHGEAPWPSAQAEIKVINAYKSAIDKLECVVRCCECINNLVAMAGDQNIAAADDLIPVLVYVLIQANPPALLSNLQYIESFAENKIREGREAYYWTLFQSSIEYIKTLF